MQSYLRKKNKKEVFVLLHDIRSVHNVGSIFRTSDAAGVSKIFLSGYTPAPLDKFGRERKDLAKVALNAEKSVPWEFSKNPGMLVKKLKKEGVLVITMEQTKNSVDYKKVNIKYPALFIMGNEVEGVPKKLLRLADIKAEIPMKGEKESLNVSVAFGIALFRILKI